MAQKYHILKEYANGVMDEKGKFFPYKFKNNVDIDAKLGVRYFVKSISLTAQKAGAAAAITGTVTITKNGVSAYIVYISAPETFAASNDASSLYVEPCVLCDVNTKIDVNFAAGTYGIVVYAEVEETEGEYSG